MKKYLLLILVIFLIFACSSDESEDYVTELTVASERVAECDFLALYHSPCLLVKEPKDREWKELSGVTDFEYERGYEFVLLVKVHWLTDIMDAPDKEYTLIRILSKKKRQSDGLPPGKTKWEESWAADRLPCYPRSEENE